MIGLMVSILPHQLLHSHEHQHEGTCEHHHTVKEAITPFDGLALSADESHDCSLCDYLQNVSFHYLQSHSSYCNDILISRTSGDSVDVQPVLERSYDTTSRGPPAC